MCVFNSLDLLCLEVAASRYIASQEPTGLWSFVISVTNSIKSLVVKHF